MLSINTNLSSLIAQRSLNNSTVLLNQAVERMSTGFKLNHAADNAANYSIVTNMNTKIGAYQVAEDNVAMGMDLLTTASESLDLINDKLVRLRALAEQAANGTYGEESLKAINSEARALIDETNRTFNNTEFNGNKLFGHSGKFLQDVQERDTTKMTSLSAADESAVITSGTYSISSAEELAKLRDMANNGLIQGGEYVLANDIDLSVYSTGTGWKPIGLDVYSEKHFKGTFDGNGHVISNLYINSNLNGVGLFDAAEGTIKNLGLENVDVKGNNFVGALMGADMQKGDLEIENCYVSKGTVSATNMDAGGLCGSFEFGNNVSIKSCYSDVEVSGGGIYIGGFIARLASKVSSVVEDSYALGNVSSTRVAIGGFIGSADGKSLKFKNCYAKGDVIAYGVEKVGGFAGSSGISPGGTIDIENCYSTGNVSLPNATRYNSSGGFIGCITSTSDSTANIKNSYSLGNVNSKAGAGGFIGFIERSSVNIDNCYTASVVNGGNSYVGGFIGWMINNGKLNLNNSYVLSKLDNINAVFIGQNDVSANNINIENCHYSSYYDTKGTPMISGTAITTADDAFSVYDGGLPFEIGVIDVGLQVGINGNENSQIKVRTSFSLDGICDLNNIGLDNADYLSKIDELVANVSAKQAEIGAAQNRLDSALDEISTQYENLVSSRSTLRDSDIAKVSSEYIRQQILQQASATLLSTANQTPALALQLI